MATLYEITDDYREALAFIDDMEVSEDEMRDTLDGLKGMAENKVLAVSAHIANLEAEAKSIAEAEDRMKRRKTALQNKAKRYRQYVVNCMTVMELEKVKNAELLVRINKPRQHVVIDDLDKLGEEFVVYERRPDKAEIKSILSTGKEIKGAHLEYGDPSMTIR